MALIKEVKTDSGITVGDAYFKVGEVNGSKEGIMFTLNSYVNRGAFLEGLAPLTYSTFTFVPDSTDAAPNIFKQAYAHLKTIDAYADATDVLEDGQSPL